MKKIKVGDWVKLRVVGCEDPYQVESIDGDEYTVVQKEGPYSHRMKLKKEKLIKI
jgi:exosome complex RNA-binding protein Csl4|tara:strand:- start:633 stop:797 length:165 start_codon:yes stop_codon:yes gene_type:complete